MSQFLGMYTHICFHVIVFTWFIVRWWARWLKRQGAWLRAGRPDVGGVEIFLHSFVYRLVLVSTQPPIKWVSGDSPGVKAVERRTSHPTSSLPFHTHSLWAFMACNGILKIKGREILRHSISRLMKHSYCFTLINLVTFCITYFKYSPLPCQQYVAKTLEDSVLHLQHHFQISLAPMRS